MSDKSQKGVWIALINPKSVCIASGVCFDLKNKLTVGSLYDFQYITAQTLCEFNAIKTLCMRDIAESISEFQARSIVEHLINKKGYKLITTSTGHDE